MFQIFIPHRPRRNQGPRHSSTVYGPNLAPAAVAAAVAVAAAAAVAAGSNGGSNWVGVVGTGVDQFDFCGKERRKERRKVRVLNSGHSG